MRVLWVHTGSWKSHAAISYIGVHNAWSFAQIGYETHLLMPDSSSKSDTDLDLRSFYGLEPHPLLHIHRINLKRNWWNLRHPYFAFAEDMARKLSQNAPLLVLSREQRFLPVLSRLTENTNCRCLFETHYLYADQSWRDSNRISRGDRKRRDLERKYLGKINGIVAITSDQLDLYRKVLPGLRGIVAPLGVKARPKPNTAQIEARRSRRTVAYIGHLMRSKGIPGMLSVVESLSRDNIRMIIYGGTDAEAKNLVASAQVANDKLVVNSFLPPADMFNALADSASLGIVALEDDFFNRHLTCPVKALDFLALGMPVVASDLPSTRDVLGEAAVYFSPGNIDQMRAKICDVLNDRELYARLSRYAIDRADLLSWESRARLLTRWLDISTKVDGEACSRNAS